MPGTPRQSQAKGYAWRVGAVIAGVVAMFVTGMVLEATTSLDEPVAFGFMAGLAVAAVLWSIGSQHLRPSAEQAMADDTRPPVLYLRAFKDDNIAMETVMAAVVSDIGPVVAIGRPGDALPPDSGAFRTYVIDADWRERAGQLLRQARLVVLRAGETPGLLWEAKQAFQTLSPAQLVLLVPSARPEYETFRALAGRALGKRLPDHPAGSGSPQAAGLAGIIRFDVDWSPRLETFERQGARERFTSDSAGHDVRVKQALRPVYEALGVPWQPPALHAAKVGIAVYAVILLLVFGAILAYLASTGDLN